MTALAMLQAAQVSLIALLFGTIVGDFALLGDVGNRAILGLWDHPPHWVTAGDGRVVMVRVPLSPDRALLLSVLLQALSPRSAAADSSRSFAGPPGTRHLTDLLPQKVVAAPWLHSV